MLNAIETYLTLRRAAGFAMSNAGYLLKSFATFAAENGQTHVQAQTAIDWAALGPTVAQRDARLRAVCRFVRHIQVEDARHELPPANHFGARKRRRPPHIYSADEIDRLVKAALRLQPQDGLRPLTHATLIALLAATGLRISEALKLTVADVTSVQGLPGRGAWPVQDHDRGAGRVHPALHAARAAERLPPHPALRALGQQPHQGRHDRAGARTDQAGDATTATSVDEAG
jgi:integrase